MADKIYIDTPESVDLVLETAGLGTRFAAALIDGVIQAVAVLVIGIAVLSGASVAIRVDSLPDLAGGIVIALLLLVLGFLFFLYKLLFELFWNGQTVGKRVMGIRVVRSNGLPVQAVQVVIRNLLRVVDYLPSSYILGAVAILASDGNQRLGDMAASTIVIRERQTVPLTLPKAPPAVMPDDTAGLRERVRRLDEAELEPLRSFWARRNELQPEARRRLVEMLASMLAERMAWPEPLPLNREEFLEQVLYFRAQ